MSATTASTSRYLLEARGVRKSFGATEVLKGVDLMVESGSLVFLIGPSGSGKSTLLRCCNRLEDPNAGSIVMDGVDLLSPRTDINAARRQIGMVFQSFNLYPHLTVLNNVTLALRKVVGMAKAEANARAMAMLELVGLPDKKGGRDVEEEGAVRSVFSRLVDPKSPNHLTDEGMRRMNAYASGGYDYLAEKRETKPHSGEEFLRDYVQLIAEAAESQAQNKAI